VAVDHRLSAAGGQVDDRQAPMPECDGPVCEDTVGVGAARHHGAGHPGPRGDVGRLAVEADFSADSTHVVFAPYGAARSVSIQVSLLPPPDDELTMRDPRAATRVRPAGMTCVVTVSSGPGRRCTNARRSTWCGYIPSPSNVGC